MSGGWLIVDSRTRQSVTMASFPTREHAQRQLDYYILRDRQGGRPDLHDKVPNWEVRHRDDIEPDTAEHPSRHPMTGAGTRPDEGGLMLHPFLKQLKWVVVHKRAFTASGYTEAMVIVRTKKEAEEWLTARGARVGGRGNPYQIRRLSEFFTSGER